MDQSTLPIDPCENEPHNWVGEKCTRCSRPTPKWKLLGNLCPCSIDGTRDHRSYCEDGFGATQDGNDDPELKAILAKMAKV